MTVNINELVKELGFCVVPTKEKPFRLDEVRFNLFAYLEDYSKMGFSFVKVATDLVKLRKEQESYRLFGQCFLGFFVIGERNKSSYFAIEKEEKFFKNRGFMSILPYILLFPLIRSFYQRSFF